MKSLFKHKPKTPADLVRVTKEGLATLVSTRDPKLAEKVKDDLAKSIAEMKTILFGDTDTEPSADLSAQLTTEIVREGLLQPLISSLALLEFESRKDASQVVANLQRQQVNGRIPAAEYLASHKELLDLLIRGYERPEVALLYGTMLRECVRHQSATKYVLESSSFERFFSYVELPNFDLASDAMATFREILTRHKPTVAEYLSTKYDWFFERFNHKLLESPNYITRRQAIKLLADLLLDRANVPVMLRYVNSASNLIIMMNLLKEQSKNIQVEAFHVFKVFVANGNKPQDIVSILAKNKEKLLMFLADFSGDKDDEQFEQDKAQVIEAVKAIKLES